MRKRNGYTLIELLVVIAILGVLAVVAIPNVVKFMNAGNVASANTELSTVQVAVTAYSVDHNGSIPANTSVLTSYITQTLQGVYTITPLTGVVIGVTYPNLTWDTTNNRWK